MTAKKVRISNWISEEAMKHLDSMAKQKNMTKASLLELSIRKIK